MGITKNKQSKESIINMAKAAFGNHGVPQVKELTEGMCNAAYELLYENGFQTVLKIASPLEDGRMSHEANLMETEVRAMRLVAEKTGIKVAQVYQYDTSRTLCSGDYFFMEKLEGSSWAAVSDSLGDDVNAHLRIELGQLQKQLSQVKGEKFGQVGDDQQKFDSLYEFTFHLIKNVLEDAEKRAVVIGVPKADILCRLREDAEAFECIKTPSLVHWDMWEGNIFVKDGHIDGIIDWERSLWGDPFMDDRFREHNRHSDFLRGFGIKELMEEEMRRIYWYDLLLYLIMMTEVTYRGYEDDGQYQWAKPKFEQAWNRLTNGIHKSNVKN